MRPSRRDITIAVTFLVSGVALSAIFSGLFGGRWQASGDGRTIYNTRTGELRFITSGESVREAVKRKTGAETLKVELEALEVEGQKWKELELKQMNEFAAISKKVSDRLASGTAPSLLKTKLIAKVEKTRLKIASDGVSQPTHAILLELWCEAIALKDKGLLSEEIVSEVHTWLRRKEDRDTEIFSELRAFSVEHAFDEDSDSAFRMYVWEPATRPLRIGFSLTFNEKLRLLDVLGQAITRVDGPAKVEFEAAKNLLLEYEGILPTFRPRESSFEELFFSPE